MYALTICAVSIKTVKDSSSKLDKLEYPSQTFRDHFSISLGGRQILHLKRASATRFGYRTEKNLISIC